MKASLRVTLSDFNRQTVGIEKILFKSYLLPYRERLLLFEILTVRLSISLEQALQEVCEKLACKAPYLDGTMPAVSHLCRSRDEANFLFKTHSRAAPLKG